MSLPVDQVSPSKQPFQLQRAQCNQCGQPMRHVAFALAHVVCRDCYGMERYRRFSPSPLPERPIEVAMTDEEAQTAPLAR